MNKQKSLVDNIILMKEWNYEKNGDLKPENFMPNSNKKVWWKCKEGHEWEAVISSRTAGEIVLVAVDASIKCAVENNSQTQEI